MAMIKPDIKLNATVTEVNEIAPGLMILKVVPGLYTDTEDDLLVEDAWELPDFKPGQYATLGVKSEQPRHELSDPEKMTPPPDLILRRPYSISSSAALSEEEDHVEFYITLVRSGTVTPRIFTLKVGDHVFLSPKFGGVFTLEQVDKSRNIILAGTGTGLAPYMSMLRTELLCNSDRKIAVIHGARHSWDLGYRAELETMARTCPNFKYVPVVSRPEEERTAWKSEIGHIQDGWKKEANGSSTLIEDKIGWNATPENTSIMLCGNPEMIEEGVPILESRGFKEYSRKMAEGEEPGNIHVERYW